MKTYIEVWKAKEAWKKLSKEERGAYLAQLAPAIQQLMAGGAEIISWGVNEHITFARADYDFFAIWKFPTEAAVSSFEKLVEGAGWYSYFDQVNLMGDATGPDQVMAAMINL